MTPILTLDATPTERSAGRLDPDRHRVALKALREDGIVVLGGIVSPSSVEGLRERALEDLRRLIDRPDAPYNWVKGNVQQDPPPFPPYLFRDVLANDVAISVTQGILGNGMKCGFYSGNTAMPSESRQPVHADEGQLWPDLAVVPPAHALVVNVPLVDMGPDNGSTEMWPGTHLDPTISVQAGDIVLPAEKVEARRAVCPPIQPVVQAGSMVIRDIRMWHAGMPNRTAEPRPMVAMIHAVAWWPTGRARFAQGSEPFLSHPDLTWTVETVKGEIDHISGVQGFMVESAL